jgi:threonylcarbamoyladenosine tRNA methylthiotransferase MtaB
MHSGRSRALLKIQDGCDAFCSYCVVPLLRGRSRSLPPEQVRAQMERFTAQGYREVVLTGIHLGRWGQDLRTRQTLGQLLEALSEGALPARVRLSSIEPLEWGTELLDRLSGWSWLCHHFHVPMQSGDDEVLRRMHRPYTAAQYAEIVHELRRRFPDAAIGGDVLAGFPGETDEQFGSTLALVRSLPLTYLHVFPYSPRPETLAASYSGRLSGTVVNRRAQLLRNISAERRQAFFTRFVGRTIEVLVESKPASGLCSGTSRNYLPIAFPHRPGLDQGSLAEVEVLGLSAKGLAARVIAIGR